MLRAVLGVTAGIAVAVVVVAVLEALGHMLFPPPPGTDLRDPAALRAIIGDIPLGAKIAVIVAWGAGVLAGGMAAARIVRAAWPAWAVGAIVLAMGAWTMVMIPHPIWMWAAAIAATAGAAYAAARFAPRS